MRALGEWDLKEETGGRVLSATPLSPNCPLKATELCPLVSSSRSLEVSFH